jgi:hypothetical protein
MPVEEGTIREALPGNEAEAERVDPLDWTEAERRALTGEADEDAAETTPLTPDAAPDDGAVSEPEDGAAGSGDPQQAAAGTEDPGAFVDTRERKESYTPEEWGRLVRQRDYFQRTNQELKDEISTVSQRVEKLGEILTKEPEVTPPSRAEDPAGYLDHRLTETNEKIDKVTETLEHGRERESLLDSQRQFDQAAQYAQTTHINQTGQKPEEFEAKLIAIRKDRYQDFIEEGYDDKKAYSLTVGWEHAMISGAFRRGENPASVFENRFARRGLTTQPMSDGATEPRPGNPAGPTAEEVVTRAQEGTKTRPLAPGDGRPNSFKVTYASLAKLSPEEFNEVMTKIEGTSKEDELDMTGSTSVVL